MAIREKDLQRIIIQRQVTEFIERGGEIKAVDHTANFEYRQPVKRSRKDQVAHMRRFGAFRGGQPA